MRKIGIGFLNYGVSYLIMEHGSVFIENREVVPVICSNTVSSKVIHEF